MSHPESNHGHLPAEAPHPIRRVLLIEEDARMGRRLLEALQESGLDVTWTYDGRQGLERTLGGPYDALVVNALLPQIPGLDLVRKLRSLGSQAPVLLLCPRAEPEDRRRCLEAGADDCLVHSAPLVELLARVRALLERDQVEMTPERVELGDLTWEPRLRRISRQGQAVALTRKEYALLVCLLEHRNEVVSRQQLMAGVWGIDIPVRGNVLDVQVRRLRSKLDDPFDRKLLRTLPGFGLILEA